MEHKQVMVQHLSYIDEARNLNIYRPLSETTLMSVDDCCMMADKCVYKNVCNSAIFGHRNTILKGRGNIIYGHNNVIHDDTAIVRGNNNRVYGTHTDVRGRNCTLNDAAVPDSDPSEAIVLNERVLAMQQRLRSIMYNRKHLAQNQPPACVGGLDQPEAQCAKDTLANDGNPVCCACRANRPRVVCLSCTHLCMCATCCLQYARTADANNATFRCPICRTRNDRVLCIIDACSANEREEKMQD